LDFKLLSACGHLKTFTTNEYKTMVLKYLHNKYKGYTSNIVLLSRGDTSK